MRCRVSGGLDSLVMGEGQILAQVKEVYKVGQSAAGFGRQLNGLFKQAITAGKRVRAETSISSGAVSVSSAAAELAQLKLPTHDFEDSKVSILVLVPCFQLVYAYTQLVMFVYLWLSVR